MLISSEVLVADFSLELLHSIHFLEVPVLVFELLIRDVMERCQERRNAHMPDSELPKLGTVGTTVANL